MKHASCLLLILCTIISASELNLCEGLWYLSFPENNGTLRATEAAYRFHSDGTAEMVYFGKILQRMEEQQRNFKKKTGKEMPTPKFTWEVKHNELNINLAVSAEGVKPLSRTLVYNIGENRQILFPKNKQQIMLLARKDATFTQEQAKQFWKSVMKESKDTFAENLKLPKDVTFAEPEADRCNFQFTENAHWRNAPKDSFQQRVVSAINNGPKLDDDAVCRISSLEKLLATPETKELLLRYLACHAEWRLYPERDGSLHAARLFRYPEGTIAPHQYYSHFLPWGEDKKLVGDPARHFQFHFHIAFGSKTWDGKSFHPQTKTERKDNTWYNRFPCGTAQLVIYDQSQFPGRHMTKAAIDLAEQEFASLFQNQQNWKQLLPKDSFRNGQPDLTLRNGMQGGIYEVSTWCNPGEKGVIYLKAFEITKGTPLSAARLKPRSSTVSGWSDNPQEQFLSAMEITIYEGNWGQFYGARFEIWFKPDDDSKPERKLFEKNYKIQGWQR